MKRRVLLFLIFILLTQNFYSQQIKLYKKDAAVWGTNQMIKGRLNSFIQSTGTLYLNSNPVAFNISQTDSTFQVPVNLSDGINQIYIQVNNSGNLINSDTLKLTLAYKLLPDIFAYASVSGQSVVLNGNVKENPRNLPLTFLWTADPKNPSPVSISNSNDTTAAINLQTGVPVGEYYFNLIAITSENDTVKARTYITVSNSGIKAFDIKNDHAAWIDSAVIYEITPYIFVLNGKFNNITSKIPDFVKLGVNTIWIQPVYATHDGGQGYDVVDYFSVRSDLGTDSDLKNLVQTAKAAGLKVMFDFVANHSSIYHPYAVNSTQYGTDSHYWDYYQRAVDSAPYSENYHFYNGFVNYFWNELPNLNYSNPEVRKWMTEAIKYWIKNYDIDGYRFDAIWGVTARYPQFTKDLRIALKSLKPELLLLAEDKAAQSQVFDQRFDVAFDWTSEYSWVSHWAWQTSYNSSSSLTIFNYQNQTQRSQLLRNALTNNGSGFAPNANVLHFLDNNDISFFNTYNGVPRTKMAAALEFTLPGTPLVYNGDEIGFTGFPYSIEHIFYAGYPLDYNDDPNSFFPLYKKLIKYRKSMPALYSNNYSEITISPSSYVFGFRRWKDDQNVFTILNMGASSTGVTFNLPVNQLNLDSNKTYYLTDLLSGEVITGNLNQFSSVSATMDAFSAKIYYLSDSIYVNSVDNKVAGITPSEFKLNQNYPNPFNPSTSIKFSLPNNGYVELKIYDILGREITSLVNENMYAGEHIVRFNAFEMPSGVYIYKLSYNGTYLTKKMLLLK